MTSLDWQVTVKGMAYRYYSHCHGLIGCLDHVMQTWVTALEQTMVERYLTRMGGYYLTKKVNISYIQTFHRSVNINQCPKLSRISVLAFGQNRIFHEFTSSIHKIQDTEI